ATIKKVTEVTWVWNEHYGKLCGTTGAESPGVKAALEICGRHGGPSRLPIRAVNSAEREALRSALLAIGAPGAK
ncbi:MAG TPA: hypothetical protein VF278_06855, partial [Pirellulales bacterium]